MQKGIVVLKNGLVDVEQADMGLASIRDHSQPLRRKSGNIGSELSTILLKTRIKNEMERGKILETKAKVEAGQLILVEEVKNEAFNKGRIVRDGLMNIPDRVASLLASINEASKIHEVLSQEIRIALEELSR